MATATKALARLAGEGLTEVLPGVGTVVKQHESEDGSGAGGHPPRRRLGGGRLSREAIVSTAIALSDSDGLGGWSMRQVAAQLGVATMALYRHVADKNALLAAMIEAALGECRLDEMSGSEPRTRLTALADALWSTFRTHPWLAGAMSSTRPQLLPAVLRYGDRVLAAITETENDPSVAFTHYLVIFNYVRGMATNLEPERRAEADSGLDVDQWMVSRSEELRPLLSAGDTPALHRIVDQFGSSGYEFDLDHIFDVGLEALLTGLLSSSSPTGTKIRRRRRAAG